MNQLPSQKTRPTPRSYPISIEHVTKSYGGAAAVDDRRVRRYAGYRDGARDVEIVRRRNDSGRYGDGVSARERIGFVHFRSGSVCGYLCRSAFFRRLFRCAGSKPGMPPAIRPRGLVESGIRIDDFLQSINGEIADAVMSALWELEAPAEEGES